MKISNTTIMSAVFAAALTACGGGGGSPGDTSEPYTISLRAERTSLPLNVGHYPVGIGVEYPYTTTLYVNAKKGSAPIPGGEDIFACNTEYGLSSGPLYYLDGKDEHQKEGVPLPYRSVTLGSNSGGNSFHFHASDQAGTAKITCSVHDPRANRQVSTSINITVGGATGMAGSIKGVATYPVLGTQGNSFNLRQSTAINASVWDDANQPVPDTSKANLQVSIRPTTTAAAGARLLAGDQKGGVVQVKTTGGVGLFSLSSGATEGSILLEMVADRTDNDVTNGIQDAITSLLVVNVSNGVPEGPAPDPLKIGADKPADATNGLPYSFALSATGGVAPYTWSALGGLPEGLSLSSSGILSGTPNVKAPGDFQVAVRVTDSKGTSTTANLTIAVAETAANDPMTNLLAINLSGCGSDVNTACPLALTNPDSPIPNPTPEFYYQYVMSVTGAGAGNAAWTATQMPSWLALDGTRGILSIRWADVVAVPALQDCRSGAFFINATRGGVTTMRKVQLVIGSGAGTCKP